MKLFIQCILFTSSLVCAGEFVYDEDPYSQVLCNEEQVIKITTNLAKKDGVVIKKSEIEHVIKSDTIVDNDQIYYYFSKSLEPSCRVVMFKDVQHD